MYIYIYVYVYVYVCVCVYVYVYVYIHVYVCVICDSLSLSLSLSLWVGLPTCSIASSIVKCQLHRLHRFCWDYPTCMFGIRGDLGWRGALHRHMGPFPTPTIGRGRRRRHRSSQFLSSVASQNGSLCRLRRWANPYNLAKRSLKISYCWHKPLTSSISFSSSDMRTQTIQGRQLGLALLGESRDVIHQMAIV